MSALSTCGLTGPPEPCPKTDCSGTWGAKRAACCKGQKTPKPPQSPQHQHAGAYSRVTAKLWEGSTATLCTPPKKCSDHTPCGTAPGRLQAPSILGPPPPSSRMARQSKLGCSMPCHDGASPKKIRRRMAGCSHLASIRRATQPPVSCSAVCQKLPRRPSASPLPSRKSRRMRASLAMLSTSGTTCAAQHLCIGLAYNQG